MEAQPSVGHSESGIPVRNLWLLMLYASELAHDLSERGVATEKQPDELPDLVGELLCYLVERRLMQNLSSGYQHREEVRTRVRGRIDMLASKRQALFEQGRVACRFDELTMNTPRNCYVRGALSHLAGLSSDPTLRSRCRTLAARLQLMGVTGPVPARAQMATERFGRHDREDRRLVATARLAFDLKIPTEQAGREVLVRPGRDEHWLRKLFEKAVAGFYAVVLKKDGWEVRTGTRQQWPVADRSAGVQDVLPSMYTDIVLEHREQNRRIVIDTKFARILTAGRTDRETLKSGYLYQMYAYLRTQERDDDPLANGAEGLLLHPAVGDEMDEWAVVQGHKLRFATVDLAATTGEIREQLLARVAL